jgi:predicted adenylyl cyclase CyaB
MEEIEAKILEVDRPKLERTLMILGAKKVFDHEILTLLYDFKNGTIIEQKNVLRLRKEQERVELTFKKVTYTRTAKTAEEYSVEVSNLETTQRILQNLGLSVIDKTQKHRVSYILDGTRFDFDQYLGEYEYIPEFLEIEAKTTGLIHKYAKVLGFEAKDCLPWSTTDLIKHYSFKKTKK